mgnify:FL=1
MQRFTRQILLSLMLVLGLGAGQSFAADVRHSTPGLSGYDPVAYFTDGKAVRGSGYHVMEHDGVTYTFAREEHQKMFAENPGKYLPAFGGYCAYGMAVGKKFVSDPEVWKIVEGVLYLNLDKGIQGQWEKDISGHIKKANTNWTQIQEKSPRGL